MRARIALAILRKELLETMRDRRTLVVMLLLPLVLYPALIVGFGQVVTHQIAKIQGATASLVVCGTLPPELLTKLAAAQPPIEIKVLPDTPPPPATIPYLPPDDDPTGSRKLREPPELKTWARRVLTERRADVVVVVTPDVGLLVDNDHAAPILLFHDETRGASQSAVSRLEDLLYGYRRELLAARLAAHPELPEGFDEPLLIGPRSVASANERGGFMAGRLLPMILLVMVMLGAFYPAIDLTAGEKERGTMQTLLTAPAHASEIIVGKFLAVFIVSMVSAIANLLSMALAFAWLLSQVKTSQAGKIALNIDWHLLPLVLVQLIPVAIFFSALMLAIAAFADGFKEAQNYLTPVYFLVIVPAALAGLPGVELDNFSAWVPGLNITLLMRDLLVAPPHYELVLQVLLANSLYAVLALALAVRIFQSEQVLLGGQGAFADAFRFRRGSALRPTPWLAVWAFAGAMLLQVYVGSLVQQQSVARTGNALGGLLVSEWLVLLLPLLLLIKFLRLDWRQTIPTGAAKWRGWAGAVLLGGSAWLILGQTTFWLQNQLLPEPVGMEKMMMEQLGLSGDAALPADWMLLLVVAITPAVCEEFLFRGLVLSGLRTTMRPWPAILLTGLCFGVIHMTIYRIVPTMVLGWLLGWVCWRCASIWPAILLHALNNGLAAMIGKHGWLKASLGDGGGAVDWRLIALAIVAFVAGLLLMPAPPPEPERGPPEEMPEG